MYMIIPQLDEQWVTLRAARADGSYEPYGPVHIRVEAKKQPIQSSKIVASPNLNQRISRIKLK